MTRELLQQALDALETCVTIEHGGFILGDEQLFSEVAVNAATKAIRAHLAQPQGKPVAWIPPERDDAFHHEHGSITAYRTPVAGWVPLYFNPAHTEAEVQEIINVAHYCDLAGVVRRILNVPPQEPAP